MDYFLHIFLCKSEIISMLKKESSMLESVKSGAPQRVQIKIQEEEV